MRTSTARSSLLHSSVRATLPPVVVRRTWTGRSAACALSAHAADVIRSAPTSIRRALRRARAALVSHSVNSSRTSAFTVCQSFFHGHAPRARAHPSAGSPSGSATPGLTRVPSTHFREPSLEFQQEAITKRCKVKAERGNGGRRAGPMYLVTEHFQHCTGISGQLTKVRTV